MDSLITAAARALAAGDPLGALKRVALREDAPALALRGIAMAQLGDFARAKVLLKSAGQAFGPREAVARARCIIAEAEIALVSRDLGWPAGALDTARATLDALGDRANAAHAGILKVRRLLLIGRLDQAERLLARINLALLPPALQAAHQLAAAGLAVRRLKTADACAAFSAASTAAQKAGVPALVAEVESAAQLLVTPAARLIARGRKETILIEHVETLLGSSRLVIDACRNTIRQAGSVVPLVSRPVLFALARLLAEAWPGDVPRSTLITHAFRARHADESHRARLRVEIGRLRVEMKAMAEVQATKEGFILKPRHASEVVVLAPLVEGPHAALLALLADGEAWATSALAIALGASPRTVQRALERLLETGTVQSFGRGPARRWMTPPVTGFPTTLLLPGPLPIE